MADAATFRNRAGALLLGPNGVPICFAVALALRLLASVLFPVEPISDSAWYVDRARELSAGMGYQEGGYPTAYWPIGWPAILGLSFRFLDPPVAVVVLNLLGAAGIMAGILWFARSVLEDEVVGRLSLAIYALYPGHIAYAGVAATETFYTAIVVLAFALLIAKRNSIGWIAFAGSSFGVATLIKPQTVLFPLGAAIAIALVYSSWGWRRFALSALALYLALFAVVLPWSVRNLVTFDRFVLVSTNGGAALLLGASDYTTGDDFSIEETPLWKRLGVPWDERVKRQVELSERMSEQARAWIRENPVEYIKWMPRKVWMLWVKDTDGFWSYEKSYSASQAIVRSLQYLNQVFYAAVLLLSAVCAAMAVREWLRAGRPPRTALLFCMPVFVTLLAAVFTGQIRYHFPAMPFLVIAAMWTCMRASSTYRGSAMLGRSAGTDGLSVVGERSPHSRWPIDLRSIRQFFSATRTI